MIKRKKNFFKAYLTGYLIDVLLQFYDRALFVINSTTTWHMAKIFFLMM